MVIVEGPDGAGKSTVVKALCERFGLSEGIRGDGVSRDNLSEYARKDVYRALAVEVKGMEPPLVWDRLFFSEYVYSPVMGHPVAFSRQETDFILQIFGAVTPNIIFCCPPLDVVMENVKGKDQMGGVVERTPAIWQRYRDIMLPPKGMFAKWGLYKSFWYDYTGTLEETGYENPDGGWAPWTNNLDNLFTHTEEIMGTRKARESWNWQLS